MRQRSLAISTKREKLIFSGSVENQYLIGSPSPLGRSINSHFFAARFGKIVIAVGRARSRAKHDVSGWFVPARHLSVRQAFGGRLSATGPSPKSVDASCRGASVWEAGPAYFNTIWDILRVSLLTWIAFCQRKSPELWL
jgi:hypothetical protein